MEVTEEMVNRLAKWMCRQEIGFVASLDQVLAASDKWTRFKAEAQAALECVFSKPLTIPSPLDASAPPRVWLQVDDQGDNEDRSEPIPVTSWCDLTWCSESIGGQEIEYVRVDRPWSPKVEEDDE